MGPMIRVAWGTPESLESDVIKADNDLCGSAGRRDDVARVDLLSIQIICSVAHLRRKLPSFCIEIHRQSVHTQLTFVCSVNDERLSIGNWLTPRLIDHYGLLSIRAFRAVVKWLLSESGCINLLEEIRKVLYNSDRNSINDKGKRELCSACKAFFFFFFFTSDLFFQLSCDYIGAESWIVSGTEIKS